MSGIENFSSFEIDLEFRNIVAIVFTIIISIFQDSCITIFQKYQSFSSTNKWYTKITTLEQNFVPNLNQFKLKRLYNFFLFPFLLQYTIKYIAQKDRPKRKERENNPNIHPRSTISDSRASFHYTLSLNHGLNASRVSSFRETIYFNDPSPPFPPIPPSITKECIRVCQTKLQLLPLTPVPRQIVSIFLIPRSPTFHPFRLTGFQRQV